MKTPFDTTDLFDFGTDLEIKEERQRLKAEVEKVIDKCRALEGYLIDKDELKKKLGLTEKKT